MKTLYFKTKKIFFEEVKTIKSWGYKVDVCAISCACGESNGALIYNNGKLETKYVLCEACYNSASNQQKGE